MREILFRGKHVHVCQDNKHLDGSWIEGYLTDKSHINDGKFEFLIRPETVCQYTWLNDKHAEPIYENDIVDFLGHRGIVKFEFGTFGIFCEKHIDWDEIQANIMPVTGCENLLYVCKNDNFISLWEIYWNFNDEDNYLSTVEVVGNVFDNPELLEGSHDGE